MDDNITIDENETQDPLQKSMLKAQDPFTSEFLYYSSVLRVISAALSNQVDKDHVAPWIQKLYRPEYQTTALREKRNRYLVFLTISLLNDELVGVFNNIPTHGKLPDLYAMEEKKGPAASWELDTMWQDSLQTLPDNFIPLTCPVHSSEDDCKHDHALDKVLDQEFQFFLYLARPYATLMKSCEDRTKVACWFQTLCTIQGKFACSSMKAIRNDYMMALLGYLTDLRAVGPFLEAPPWRILPPLAEAVKNIENDIPITDPTGPDANEFLIGQPVPEDGAFCYIAITGDLINSSFGGPAP